MTRDDDIERVLSMWFTEGPTQMPTRFLEDTLDRIDRVPQSRLASLRTRLPAMYPSLRLAAIVAILVSVAVAGSLYLGPSSSVPSAGSGGPPVALEGQWSPVGHRLQPNGSGYSPLDWDIVIDATSVLIWGRVDIQNSASLVGSDRLDLQMVNVGTYWHCQVGDAGSYTFRLGPGDPQVRDSQGNTPSELLTLTPLNDACADRATVLEGVWFPTAVAPSSPPETASATPPSASASPTIPDELQHVWLGPARDIPALGGPQALSIIRIRDAKFDYLYTGQGQEALNSTVSVSADMELRFTSTNTTGGCHVGDEGIYAWSLLAPNDEQLTITEVSDACAPRIEAVVGKWVLSACKDFGCLGDISAGTHQTAFFEPLGNRNSLEATWRMQYGGMSYTVPSGWANATDDPNFYNLVPTDDYAKPATDALHYPGIVLLPDIAVAAQDDACSPKVEPGVGQSAVEMAARIATIPSLEVSAATPITVSGRPGTMQDLALSDGWNQFCAVYGGVPLLRQGGAATEGADGWDRQLLADEHWRLILVDVAEGQTMAIVIDDLSQPARFDDLVAQAMPIVSSFEFHVPAT